MVVKEIFFKEAETIFRQEVAPTRGQKCTHLAMQFRIQASVAMVTRSLKTGISKALVQVFWTCC